MHSSNEPPWTGWGIYSYLGHFVFAPCVGFSHDFASSAPPPKKKTCAFAKSPPRPSKKKGEGGWGFLAFGAPSRQIPTLSQSRGGVRDSSGKGI